MSVSQRQLANSSGTRWPPIIHLMLLEKSLTDYAVFRQRDNSSVFMTVGYSVTPWRPQFFRAVTLESQQMRTVHQHIVAESALGLSPLLQGHEGNPSLRTALFQQRNTSAWCS